MEIKGWRFYNHAAIPTCAPHEMPDLTPINDGTIWKLGDGKHKPLLARWTEKWDCGYNTGFYNVIKERPFNLNDLPHSARKSIRRSMESVSIRQIKFCELKDDIWRVYNEATSRYEGLEKPGSYEQFVADQDYDGIEWWGAFEKKTNKLIGYKKIRIYDEYADFVVSKYNQECRSIRGGDALNYVVIDYYINACGKKYIDNGTRSISHRTNVQDYYEERFGFRKAYCELKVKYRPGIGIIVTILYFFRDLLKKIDGIPIIHLINSVIKMEEIVKRQSSDK